MPQVSIDIPTGQATRVIAALCASAGLSPSAANAKRAIIAHVKNVVVSYERGQAEQAARDAVTEPTEPTVT